MPTEKQSAASRANSQHSTGPRTTEGKAKSRFNALKHGIFAESHIIFDESAEALNDLAAEYRERFNPADAAGRCLVDVLIDSEWRLRRLRRVETQTWGKMNCEILDHRRNFAKHPDEVVAPTAGEVFCGDMEKFTAIQRAIGACQRDYRQTLKELRLRATDIPVCRPAIEPEQSEPTSEPSVGQAFPPASATGIPACRPAAAEPEPVGHASPPAPEPEENKPTSESSASFPNNSPNPPQVAPKPPANPTAGAEPAPPVASEPSPDLPQAA